MKTAISLPDETFERAERVASELGMTRSELYSRALSRYLDELDRSSLTARINAAIARSGEDDEMVEAATRAGRRTLSGDGNEW